MVWEDFWEVDPPDEGAAITASLDCSTSIPRFVIADPTTDDAWLSIDFAETASLRRHE